MTVSYPKKMKERAKSDGKGLLTLDVPGFTYQTPATDEMISDVYDLFQKWQRQKEKEDQ